MSFRIGDSSSFTMKSLHKVNVKMEIHQWSEGAFIVRKTPLPF